MKTKVIKEKIYEKIVSLEKNTLTFEIQLSKIVQNEEERRSNKEISDFIANMY